MKAIKETWQSLPGWGKVAIIVTGGYITYRVGKKIINRPIKHQLPQGGAGLPVVSYTPTGTAVYWNPAPMSKDLFEVMSGLFTASGTKDATWTKFAQLPTDDMIVATYNFFNREYGNGDTLTKWIKDEFWSDITGSGKELALNRLSSLNLV